MCANYEYQLVQMQEVVRLAQEEGDAAKGEAAQKIDEAQQRCEQAALKHAKHLRSSLDQQAKRRKTNKKKEEESKKGGFGWTRFRNQIPQPRICTLSISLLFCVSFAFRKRNCERYMKRS